MLRLDDIVCFIFLLAYISPSYLLLPSPGSLLAFARSLNLIEYQRDTHVLNIIVLANHRYSRSSFVMAIFPTNIWNIRTLSAINHTKRCDHRIRSIDWIRVRWLQEPDRWKNREPTFRFRRLRIKGTAARKPWDEDLRKTGTGPIWEAGWTLYLVTSENGGQRMGRRTVDAKLSCFVPSQLLQLIPLENIWPFIYDLSW